MRCLQHVLWRGALALGLLVSGGTGAMLMPQPAAPACQAAAQQVIRIGSDATATIHLVTIDRSLAAATHNRLHAHC